METAVLGLAYSEKYKDLGLPECYSPDALVDLYITRLTDKPNDRAWIYKKEDGTQTFRLDTGVVLDIPKGWVGEIFINRHFTLQTKASLLTGVGLVLPAKDLKELTLSLVTSDRDVRVEEGMLVAHMILRPIYQIERKEIKFSFKRLFKKVHHK